jgi:hypothetical protein
MPKGIEIPTDEHSNSIIYDSNIVVRNAERGTEHLLGGAIIGGINQSHILRMIREPQKDQCVGRFNKRSNVFDRIEIFDLLSVGLYSLLDELERFATTFKAEGNPVSILPRQCPNRTIRVDYSKSFHNFCRFIGGNSEMQLNGVKKEMLDTPVVVKYYKGNFFEQRVHLAFANTIA